MSSQREVLPPRRILVSGVILKVCALAPLNTMVSAGLLTVLIVPWKGRAFAGGALVFGSAPCRVNIERSEAERSQKYFIARKSILFAGVWRNENRNGAARAIFF